MLQPIDPCTHTIANGHACPCDSHTNTYPGTAQASESRAYPVVNYQHQRFRTPGRAHSDI